MSNITPEQVNAELQRKIAMRIADRTARVYVEQGPEGGRIDVALAAISRAVGYFDETAKEILDGKPETDVEAKRRLDAIGGAAMQMAGAGLAILQLLTPELLQALIEADPIPVSPEQRASITAPVKP